MATRSTADHPGGLGGFISVTVCVCECVDMCVYVSIAGYGGWQSEQEGLRPFLLL